MPRSVAARRRRKQRWLGIVLIAGVLALLVPLGGWFVYAAMTREAMDNQTGCLTRGYDSVNAVLIDTTDALTPVQAEALGNILDKLKAGVPKYGRLEIYSLEPITTQPLAPIFAACNPGSGADVPSWWTGNPVLAQKRWNQEFGSKVDETLRRLLAMKAQDSSPILEAIQSIAVTAFGSVQAQHATSRDLVIVSDLIQNTPSLSMYRGAPAYDTFQRTQYYREVRAKLYGVTVHLDWIPRTTRKDVQDAHFRDFWRQYVADAGGDTKEWTALQ